MVKGREPLSKETEEVNDKYGESSVLLKFWDYALNLRLNDKVIAIVHFIFLHNLYLNILFTTITFTERN